MSASSTEGPFGASFLAVKRCCEAWNRALTLSKDQGKEDREAIRAAEKAYRRAMPFLTGEQNIRAFIAAVAQGMILGAFGDKEGAKLVYVAQVALNGLSRSSQPAGRAAKNSPSPEPPQASDVQPQPAPAEPTEPSQEIDPNTEEENKEDFQQGTEQDTEKNAEQDTIPSIQACVEPAPASGGCGEIIPTPLPPPHSQNGTRRRITSETLRSAGDENHSPNLPPPQTPSAKPKNPESSGRWQQRQGGTTIPHHA